MLRIKLEGSVRTKDKIIAVEIETLFLDIGHNLMISISCNTLFLKGP